MIRITLRKENMGQRNFKRHFEFHNFSQIFYFGMTRLRNTSLDAFTKCQYIRFILRKKNMGQIWNMGIVGKYRKYMSLIKKYSKFLNFDEIFYCGMTRLRNTIMNVCGLCQYVKVVKPKKVLRRSFFKASLMQIWKSANIFVFIWKYVEDFTPKHLLICALEICGKFVYKHSETVKYVEN